MLHRYEEIVLNPLVMDLDISISKIFLLKQYGFESEELLRDPLNFFLKFANEIPVNVDPVSLSNIVSQYDAFTSSSLIARWSEVYSKQANKIPLANISHTYYELWALVINRYRLAITQYINKLNLALLCEGLPYPNIFIQGVFGTPDSDVILNSNYVVFRIYITDGA